VHQNETPWPTPRRFILSSGALAKADSFNPNSLNPRRPVGRAASLTPAYGGLLRCQTPAAFEVQVPPCAPKQSTPTCVGVLCFARLSCSAGGLMPRLSRRKRRDRRQDCRRHPITFFRAGCAPNSFLTRILQRRKGVESLWKLIFSGFGLDHRSRCR
jgi:hypothetical protein